MTASLLVHSTHFVSLHFRSVKEKFGVLFKDCIILIYCTLLGAFEILRKATVSLVMDVLPSVRLIMEQLSFHWTDFHEV